MKALFKSMVLLFEKCEKKYLRLTSLAGKKLINFYSSCLVECGFGVVAGSLHAMRNQQEIIKRSDMRLKLTNQESRIKQLFNQH